MNLSYTVHRHKCIDTLPRRFIVSLNDFEKMETIIYRIAEQIICLHTPNADNVRQLLTNYAPFEIGAVPSGEEALLNVWGNTDMTPRDDDKLIEEVEDIYYHSQVYRHQDSNIRIEMQYQGQRETAYFTDDWHTLHCVSSLEKVSSRYLIDRFIMIAFSILTSRKKMLKVHASVTELNGRALIFMGVSGTGKSTHSRLWRQYVSGAKLLNDDEPIVRLMPDGGVRVYGCPWSGSTPCYRAESAEVVAFVHLYQAPENKLSKLSGRASFDSLYSSTAFMLSDAKNQFDSFNTVADVLEKVPIYRLDCRPDEEAVRLTQTLLS